jgi:bifunctional non-homologous end joining protein LigD
MKAKDLTGLIHWDQPRPFAALATWLAPGYIAERKYNGDRATLRIRKGRSTFGDTRSSSFPYWAGIAYDEPVTIKLDGKQVDLPGLDGTILDGEFVAGFDDAGRELNRDISSGWFGSGPTRARAYEVLYGRPVFVVFDLLMLAGDDYTSRPYTDRRESLEQVAAALAGRYPDSGIMLAEQLPASARSIRRALTAGWEGLILKRTGSRYLAGKRADTWLKVKAFADLDVYLTGGWKPGEGGRAGTVGAVEVAIATPDGPMLLADVAVKPNLAAAYTDPATGGLRPELAGTVWEVRANGLTVNGRLIHPRMMHVRRDKTSADTDLAQLDALPAAA